MPEVASSSGSEAIITPCLQLRFTWRGDHWKHELISGGGCRAIPRIWSVEGQIKHRGPDEVASPAFERLRIAHDRPGVTVAHLSGESGRHRSEGTFTVEEHPDGAVIDVEVSHAEARPGEAFSATYLVEASAGELEVAEAATIAFRNPDVRLVFEAVAPARVEAHEAGMGTIRLKATSEPNATHRAHSFHYRWRWIQAPGHQAWDRTA